MDAPAISEEVARAVMMQESSGGVNVGPRYEPGFQRRYGAKWLREGDAAFRQSVLRTFGEDKVYASYGPWQVMFPVAVELGFRGTPAQLADPVVNRQYFEKKLTRDLKAARGNLDAALLRYNGGGDPDYPAKVRRFLGLPPETQAAQDRTARARRQGR